MIGGKTGRKYSRYNMSFQSVVSDFGRRCRIDLGGYSKYRATIPCSGKLSNIAEHRCFTIAIARGL